MRSTLVVTCPAHVWDKTALWEFSNFFFCVCVFFLFLSEAGGASMSLGSRVWAPGSLRINTGQVTDKKALKVNISIDVAGEQ